MSYLTKSMGSNYQHLVKHFFPNGFRVLIVDVDPESLQLARGMLLSCNYIVTLCEDPKVALSILRERHEEFDLVLAEVFMAEMDGFELLQALKSELNIPVVLMTSGNDMDLKLNGIMKGATSFIDKPLEQVSVSSIWKNVAWKKVCDEKKMLIKLAEINQRKKVSTSSNASLMDEGKNNNQEDDNQNKNNKGKSAMNDNDSVTGQEVNNNREEDHQIKKLTRKNGRLSWNSDLKKSFENALIQLGPDAVPGKIAKIMNVEGVERHHVASYLQKYRIRKLKKALSLQPNNEANQVISTHMYHTQLHPQSQSFVQPQLQHELQSESQHASIVPDNNPISYIDISSTVTDLQEMSIKQQGVGLNENLEAPPYPQLYLEHHASVEDNLHNNSENFLGFSFENFDVPVVNEVGSLSNIDATMSFTNLLNMVNDGNEDPEFLNWNFLS